MTMVKSGARLALAVFLVGSLAQAFPELTRHGYTNCTACHVSPSGGGALSPYGRELSRELVSTWGFEGEQGVGALWTPPESIAVGGDVRTVYTYRDNPVYREGKWYFMQADVEAYYTYDKFTVGGSIGAEKPDSTKNEYKSISRRHYLLYRWNDQITIRGGRFQPAYGINLPDHYVTIKRDLGWDMSRPGGSETYNAEFAYLGEEWIALATAIFGRPDDLTRKAETGGALNVSRAFWERFRVGGSFYFGDNDLQSRQVVGPYAILGFTPHFFLLSEIDWQNKVPKSGKEQHGIAWYHKLGYEVYKGVVPYGTYELRYLDDSDPNSQMDAVGIGAQLFPRPHFEFNGTYQKTRSSAYDRSWVDLAYFRLHYYF